LTDKERLSDILATEKYLANIYNTSASEASNVSLFEFKLKMLEDIHKTQREVFDLMHQKGWYNLEGATENKKEQDIMQLEKELDELPY